MRIRIAPEGYSRLARFVRDKVDLNVGQFPNAPLTEFHQIVSWTERTWGEIVPEDPSAFHHKFYALKLRNVF